MDERYRTLLDKNRTLLVKNLILTEEFFDLLQREKVLPQSMITDVKEEGLSREERAARLLSGLQLRTNAAFRRFRRVLLATGHSFLADVLWDEETTFSDLEDTISSRYPAIFERVPDDIRKKLVASLDTLVRLPGTILETQVKEKALMSSWQTSPIDRLEVMRARASDFKHERHLRQTIDNLRTQVKTLQSDLHAKEGEVHSLTIDVESMSKVMERLQQDHRKDIEKQANFNTANSKTVMRLKERFDGLNMNIAHMNQQLKAFLGEDAEKYDGESENIKIMERNLKKVLDLANIGRENRADGAAEKEVVCYLLGLKKSKYLDKSFSEIVKGYLKKDEKAKLNLLKEIQKVSNTMNRDNPTLSDHKQNQATVKPEMRVLSMQVAMVQAQLEHLHKKLIWKDSELDSLRTEVQTLRKTVSANAKPRSKQSHPQSPEMTREMKVAYAHVNDYLKEDVMETMNSPGSIPPRNMARLKPAGGMKPVSQGGPRRHINLQMPLAKEYDVRTTDAFAE